MWMVAGLKNFFSTNRKLYKAVKEYMNGVNRMKEEEKLEEARKMGKRIARPVPDSVLHDEDGAHHAADSYCQTAEYANHVLPALRKMAGYGDAGAGTYTIKEKGDEFLYQELVDQFWIGFHEAIDEAT